MVAATPLDRCPLIRERSVDVKGYKMNYLEAGHPDRETVVLCHGFGAWARGVWTSTIAELGHHYRVIAPDLLGFGRSDKPDYDFYDEDDPFRRGVTYLARFLDEVGFREGHVVGNSLGGLLALRLALERPRSVRSLSLVSSLGLGREIHFRYKVLAMPGVKYLLWRPTRAAVRQAWRSIVHDPSIVTDDLVDQNLAFMRQPGADRPFRVADRAVGLRGQRFVYTDRLRELAMPVFLLWGRDDPIFPVAHAREAARHLRRGRLSVFDRCGHVPPVEAPARFNAALMAFLESAAAHATTPTTQGTEEKGLSGATG